MFSSYKLSYPVIPFFFFLISAYFCLMFPISSLISLGMFFFIVMLNCCVFSYFIDANSYIIICLAFLLFILSACALQISHYFSLWNHNFGTTGFPWLVTKSRVEAWSRSVGASLRESGCVGWRLLSFMTWFQALFYMPPTTRQPRGLAALLGLLSNLDFLSVLRKKWPPRWRPLCVEGEEGVEVVLECAQGLASQHPLL